MSKIVKHIKVANKMKKKARVYECPYCFCWHIGKDDSWKDNINYDNPTDESIK